MDNSSAETDKEYVRQIVSQYRSGEKNRADAFNELRGMLQTIDVADTESSISGATGDGNSNHPGPELNEDDRVMIMNRIKEERENSKNQSSMLNDSLNNTDPHSQYNTSKTNAHASGGAPKNAWGPTEYEGPPGLPAFKRQDTKNIDARTHRIAQAESAIRSEMFKECTFRPTIKPLPAAYNQGSSGGEKTPFYERVTKWQREKEIEAVRRKELVDESEVVDCTFHPRINRNSDKAVKQLRVGDKGEDAAERLYRSNETAHYQRSKFIEDELRQEKLKEDAQCTFKPMLSTHKKKFAYVKSKYDQPLNRRVSEVDYTDDNERECTFTPRVKGVRRDMPSAKLYVNTNVVDRLTRPVTAGGADDSMRAFDTSQANMTNVIDVGSFIGSMGGGSSENYLTPGTKSLRPNSAPKERSGRELTGAEKVVRQKQFKEFLSRQSQMEIKKAAKNVELEKAITPKFQPRVSNKSHEIMKDSLDSAPFLSRVERDIERRASQDKRRMTEVKSKNSFKPKLNTRSKEMARRSSAEMSHGDMLRKAANFRMMKLKREQAAMAEYTFKPSISKRAQSHGKATKSGQLKTDPLSVIHQYEEKKKNLEEERMRREQEKAEEELKDCTFAPVIKDCPAYVSRIVRSFKLVNEAKKAHEVANMEPEKEPWK